MFDFLFKKNTPAVVDPIRPSRVERKVYTEIDPAWPPMTIETLLTVEEYITKQCLFDQTSWPINIPEDLQRQMKVLDLLVVELLQAIKERKALSEIYSITKRFHPEGGMFDYVRCPKLEKSNL